MFIGSTPLLTPSPRSCLLRDNPLLFNPSLKLLPMLMLRLVLTPGASLPISPPALTVCFFFVFLKGIEKKKRIRMIEC